ncbi:hypothetical protein UFOVP964_7 [uncultured Caudovirales phage]|uniref:Uncharacterized protein n=1 Tax=uncultured Caudovirales phage TaxID=2100421 RepID=A0A6J7XIF4_9CAUD|nr:hypothetical protein UFOVP854_7 [uncultured Caudovirales phage]CAB4173722.1 hypothetical protein UFOVP964_7 [uncultured Caudovirales phage]CAB4179564.1 hypothetical protein UFOVP1034_151 [uncultured Caudovirales phage]CAB4189195.1 hypothetical protein UFOVP1177_151 [uncultured Caudovirales phage]CAB4193727.1 hypothetical protein UFOVP1243_138 [uncultured Caudovirales phage]
MNLVQKAVQHGGRLTPLIIPAEVTGGMGIMNPSIFSDDDGDTLCIIRVLNYTLYHAENDQRFPSVWGPLAYLHPEKDQHLRTENYFCRLDKDFNVVNYCKIEMQNLHTPIWEFVGLEDARLIKWGGKYYGTGVRRDTTTNGQGRMELSELEIDKEAWTAKEVSRVRIQAPVEKDSYCEKNWMPVLDKDFHYIKWTSPTELVKANPVTGDSEQAILTSSLLAPTDQRGGSQVINWGENYIAITHETALLKNYMGQKDGVYRHRLCVWDKDFNLIGISPEAWSFLDAKIEFVCGATVHENNLLLSWGFQDNAAMVLEVPNSLVNEMVQEALSYGN